MRLGETLPSRTFHAKLQGLKCCLYETPYYVAAPIREVGDVITHLQGPELFLGLQVTRFSETHLNPVLAPTFFFEEATCKSSTINGLLYAHEALIVAQRYDVPQD